MATSVDVVYSPSKRRVWKKFALAALATAIGLALAELAVRAFVPVRNIGPSFTVFDPAYGKKLKRSYSCRRITPEFTMQFTTNSLAFRGLEPEAFPHYLNMLLGHPIPIRVRVRSRTAQ